MQYIKIGHKITQEGARLAGAWKGRKRGLASGAQAKQVHKESTRTALPKWQAVDISTNGHEVWGRQEAQRQVERENSSAAGRKEWTWHAKQN